MQYGLIGEHLIHNFSDTIHKKIASYNYELNYELRELGPGQVDDFMKKADFSGINVASPYKETVIPYLDEISDEARKIGAVNTIVNKNGRLCGYNTDYFGMRELLLRAGIDPAGKKVLILGTEESGRTADAVVSDLGAAEIYNVSRTAGEGIHAYGEGILTYEEACRSHADAEIIINTTSCGMYPNIDDIPISLDSFPKLTGLIDVIYNPLRPALVLEAQKRGIPAQGGLYMLVIQSIRAAELFTGTKIDPETAETVYREILNSRRNIVLTGMSLAGKTTLGTLLSRMQGKTLMDIDEMIVQEEQRPITEIFSTNGETYFRDLETAAARALAPRNGLVISTGGGTILRQENVDALKKNGCVIFLDRPLDLLRPADDRPLADTAEKVISLMEQRYPIYRSTCDHFIVNDSSPEDGVDRILQILQQA